MHSHSLRDSMRDSDTVSSTTWFPQRTITVEGDEAVLSRIMHIVTLTVREFVNLCTLKSYRILVISLIGLADFSGFLCSVGTRQKLKITN